MMKGPVQDNLTGPFFGLLDRPLPKIGNRPIMFLHPLVRVGPSLQPPLHLFWCQPLGILHWQTDSIFWLVKITVCVKKLALLR